jgi:hypothetical protein
VSTTLTKSYETNTTPVLFRGFSERMSIKYNPVCNPVGHGSQAVYVHVKDQASTSSSSKMC